MFPDGRIVFFVALALVLSMAVPAGAQAQRGSRLPGGLFGSEAGDFDQSLGASVSAGAGRNRSGLSGAAVPALDSSFGHLAANLNYSLSRSLVGIWAGASSSAQYYSGAARQWQTRHTAHAGASFAIPVAGRTSLHLSQSATYQPLQTVSLFPGLQAPGAGVDPMLPIDPDLATTSDGYVSYDSAAGLSYQLSRRSAVSVDAGYRRSGRISSPDTLSTVHGGGQFRRELSRGLGLRLGYAYTRGEYGSSAQVATFEHHHLDTGVDYGRSLSLTRRTTLSFSTGSVILTDGQQHRFYVNGDARLSYDLARTWRASMAYRRAAEFVGTLRAPVAGDAVSAGISGFPGQRVRVHATIGASRGAVGLGAQNRFSGYYAATGLTMGLTSYVALDVSYSFFRSDFASAALLAPGVPDQFNRQSVRASIRLWAPLLTRVRRTNAAG